MATSHHYPSVTGAASADLSRVKPGTWVAPGHAFVATIILVFAMSLRVPQLKESSLWFDDAWVALVSRMSASQLGHIGMTAFGFDVILWAWFKAVGFSEVSAKFIPFIAGCLASVAVYVMVIRKGLGWIPGIIAALILVAAPMDIQYAATVKQYTSEALLTVLLIWLAWTLLEEPRRKNIVWLGVIACFGVVVSGMTVFVAAPAICIPTAWTSLKHRERRLDCILVAAATLAFIGAWLLFMASDAANPALRLFWAKYYVVRTEGLRGTIASSLDLAKQFAYGLTHRRFAYVATAAVAATIIAVRRRPVLTAVLWSPIVLVYLASLTGRAPFGGGRTDIFLHPLLAVLAALATDETLRLIRERWLGKTWQSYAGVAALALVIILILRGVHPAFPNHPEEDLRPLAVRLMEQKQNGDVVLVYPAAKYGWFLYSKEPFSIAPRAEHPEEFLYTMEAKDTVVLDDSPEINSTYASDIRRTIGANRIWFVASHLGYLKGDNNHSETEKIEADIQRNGYRLARKEERPRAFIELWTRSVGGK